MMAVPLFHFTACLVELSVNWPTRPGLMAAKVDSLSLGILVAEARCIVEPTLDAQIVGVGTILDDLLRH